MQPAGVAAFILSLKVKARSRTDMFFSLQLSEKSCLAPALARSTAMHQASSYVDSSWVCVYIFIYIYTRLPQSTRRMFFLFVTSRFCINPSVSAIDDRLNFSTNELYLLAARDGTYRNLLRTSDWKATDHLRGRSCRFRRFRWLQCD